MARPFGRHHHILGVACQYSCFSACGSADVGTCSAFCGQGRNGIPRRFDTQRNASGVQRRKGVDESIFRDNQR